MNYFITTAIDYPNGAPHIGHAFEKILADVLARYHRLKGEEVYYLTGVDQHGQKMQQTADAEGVNVATLAKRNTKKFQKLWEKLGLSYNGWAETTADAHKKCVQRILSELHDKGQLYKKGYRGFYSVRQEQYLTEKDRNEQGEFGPEWGEVVELEEENWYFKLSEHTEWLREVVTSGKFGIEPAFRRTEVVNAIERASDIDLCISRPKERLHWGIELPFDPDFVTYVWFDALINYVSFAGYLKDADSDLPNFDELWPAQAQVIGKDILVPAHSIYWPCMMHAMGFTDEQLPTLLVHGWWNIKGEKMSKSIGNVVDPDALADHFGVDALRYYLVRDIANGKDSDFDPDRLITIFNTELANDLGNLLNRSLNMTTRFLGGTLAEPIHEDEETVALRQSLVDATAAYRTAMDGNEVSAGLKAINDHVTHCNGFIQRYQPWVLAKEEEKKPQLESALYHLCESCAHLAILLSPILPDASAKILGQLRLEEASNLLLDDLTWGLLKPGHETGKQKPVFPRIAKPEE